MMSDNCVEAVRGIRALDGWLGKMSFEVSSNPVILWIKDRLWLFDLKS